MIFSIEKKKAKLYISTICSLFELGFFASFLRSRRHQFWEWSTRHHHLLSRYVAFIACLTLGVAPERSRPACPEVSECFFIVCTKQPPLWVIVIPRKKSQTDFNLYYLSFLFSFQFCVSVFSLFCVQILNTKTLHK